MLAIQDTEADKATSQKGSRKKPSEADPLKTAAQHNVELLTTAITVINKRIVKMTGFLSRIKRCPLSKTVVVCLNNEKRNGEETHTHDQLL